jgi:hypothetical protein
VTSTPSVTPTPPVTPTPSATSTPSPSGSGPDVVRVTVLERDEWLYAGEDVTLAVSVSPASRGSITVTDIVNGGVRVTTGPVTVRKGRAVVELHRLAAGRHVITARFAPATGAAASSSQPVTLDVNAVGRDRDGDCHFADRRHRS